MGEKKCHFGVCFGEYLQSSVPIAAEMLLYLLKDLASLEDENFPIDAAAAVTTTSCSSRCENGIARISRIQLDQEIKITHCRRPLRL